jgi:hypothetical protein
MFGRPSTTSNTVNTPFGPSQIVINTPILPGNPNPYYVPPPPPSVFSTPASAPTTILPNSAPTPTSTPVLQPAPINIFSSTQQQIADYLIAYENWENYERSQSSANSATTVLPNSAPAPSPTPTPSPSRKVDPTLTSEQQAALDELWVNNYQGWSEYRQNQHMNLLYSMWGKTVPTSFTITTTPAPAPASNQYSISNQLQQGMNALIQGEELPPFSQPPQPQGPNIFDTNSNAFSGILNQLTDISNSNWRETYDPYGLNPPPPNTEPIDASYTPQTNYTLIIAGVGALVLVYFYTKK